MMAKRARLTAPPAAVIGDAAGRFPLLRLPQKEILRTIRIMGIDLILIFSLISNRCKNLAASIKWKGLTVQVTIGKIVQIALVIKRDVFWLEYRTQDWNTPKSINERKLTTPLDVITYFGNHRMLAELDWNKNFEMKDWVRHLLFVFSRKSVDQVHFTYESTEFNVDDMKENFGTPAKLIADNTRNHEYNQLMLQKFLPVDRLCTKVQMFENSKIPTELLTQNMLNLEIGNDDDDIKLTLDELLMAKSKSLEFGDIHFSETDFNKFIKRWLRHGANPDLEYLCINYPGCGRKDDLTIMRGIRHQQIPSTERRWFKTEGYENPIEVKGGNDIFRKDGMKATIQVDDWGQHHCWHMFIWKEQCVVEDDEL